MKRWKYMVVLVLSILLAVGLIRGIPILAAENTDMETIQVTGTYGQTEARQMLSLINEFRTSGEAWYWNESDTAKVSCGQLDALTYDYELERIAMQRAMEIAIYYSHTRPNGTDCFTLNTQGARAENIAAGYTTYEDVYIGWKEDNENHAGQGHRRNMLSEKYKVIGIGHVVYNGTHYWVQEFSSVVQDVVQKTANDSEQTVSIDILSSNITEKNIAVNSESCSVAFGKINNLPTVQGQIQTKEGWPENVFMPVDVTPEYSIENTYYASIINGSSVKGLNVGDTNITVSALGVNKIIPLTITPVSIQNAEITLKNNSYIYNGSMIQPAVQSVTVDETELGKNDYNVSYENNTNVGIGKVIVTGTGNYNGSVETSFTINPCNISTGILSEINNQTYTGEELKPSVILKVNNQSLSLDKDYTVSYENNINAGAATVTVVGKGNYTGTLTTEFQIVPRSISEGMVNQIGEQEYTGDAIVPGINLEVNHKTLTQGADYTIQYNNNTNCGNAEVAISGKGNYTGALTIGFKIVPRDIGDCAIGELEDQMYDGSEKTPEVEISFNGMDLEKGQDYSLVYKDNIDAGIATVTIIGEGNYTGTTIKEFSICPADITDCQIGSIMAQEYSGESITPAVAVSLDGTFLVRDQDYTVTYEQNLNVGQTKAVIKGIGNYSGSKEATFEITMKSIEGGNVAAIPDQPYTGMTIVPDVTLTVDGRELEQDKDYVVTADSENITVGDARVLITGNGNYKGTLIATFKIVPRDISTCVINDIADQIYTGQSLFPLVNVSFNGVDLEQNIDYEIRYENNIEIGTAEVIITGKGNYTGETEKTFSIKKEEVIDPETGSDDDTSGSQSGISDQPSDDGQSGDPSSSEQSQPPANPDSFGNPSAPAVGETILSSDQTTSYKITGEDTVEYAKSASARKKAKVTIPSTVTYGGKTYQVTSVAAKAFKGSKKLKKATIPSTVTKIGKQAFASCKKLKTITIKTKKLTAKSVGKKAFKGINPKAVIKVPKKKLDAYRTILKARGVGGSVKIK